MKQYKFIIIFSNHCFEEVFAFGKKEAVILAQAEQIKKGNSFNVTCVKWFKNNDDHYIKL